MRIEGQPFPPLPLASAGDVHVGDQVLALGSPLGFDQSVSAGVVSAVRADYPSEWKNGHKVKAGPLVQHTATLAPGSSGSPLVDKQGRVVGINHSLVGSEGANLYFAAHVSALHSLLAKTDLHASAKRIGSSVQSNLLISAAVFAALAALLFGVTRRDRRVRSRAVARKTREKFFDS